MLNIEYNILFALNFENEFLFFFGWMRSQYFLGLKFVVINSSQLNELEFYALCHLHCEWIANLLEPNLQAGGDVDGKLDETAANLILDMKPSKVVSNELTVSCSLIKVLLRFIFVG